MRDKTGGVANEECIRFWQTTIVNIKMQKIRIEMLLQQ